MLPSPSSLLSLLLWYSSSYELGGTVCLEQIIFTLFTLYNFRRPFPAQLTPTTTPLHQQHIFHPPFVVRIRREFFFDILFFDKRRKLTFMMQKLKQEQEQDYALLLWLFAKYKHRDTHPLIPVRIRQIHTHLPHIPANRRTITSLVDTVRLNLRGFKPIYALDFL